MQTLAQSLSCSVQCASAQVLYMFDSDVGEWSLSATYIGLNVYEMTNRACITYALTVQVNHFHGSIVKAKMAGRRRQRTLC